MHKRLVPLQLRYARVGCAPARAYRWRYDGNAAVLWLANGSGLASRRGRG
jgi:hypothetical protein